MKRLVIALALAIAAPLAACGPDCTGFCRHWVADCGAQTGATDLGRCINGCNEVGSDYAAFIACAMDKTCPELAAGHCRIPSAPPGIFP